MNLFSNEKEENKSSKLEIGFSLGVSGIKKTTNQDTRVVKLRKLVDINTLNSTENDEAKIRQIHADFLANERLKKRNQTIQQAR